MSGTIPRHVAEGFCLPLVPPVAATPGRDSGVSVRHPPAPARRGPGSFSRRWHGLAEQLGLTLPQFPKIGLAHDRPRRARIRYGGVG